VSDDRHDEIAARLRAEAGARAPERLQADVMLRVRAEPRPRRIRRRRTYWRPLGSLAAAACLLGAAVLGISHLSLSGGGSASGGASGGGETVVQGAAGAGGASLGVHALERAAPAPANSPSPAPALTGTSERPERIPPSQARALALVPMPLRYAVAGRLKLDSALPKALGTLDLHRSHGSH
jgi:hypothetical protein